MAVCSEVHSKHINTLCEQNVELPNVKHDGTYSDHWALEGSSSVIQTSQLMLYREIMAVCSEIHTKHINTAVWAERGFLFKPESYLKTQSVPRSKHFSSLL